MNLKTLIFIFFSLVLIATLATGQTTPYNKLDKLKVNDLIAGKLEVQSTSKSSLPCPSMTQVQRDAIVSPQDGSCVYNNDTNVLNIYNGTEWVEVGSGGGGGGGIENWETAKFYEVGDVVIESNKIYQCNTQHTSSVFATDIANWTKLVAPISLTTEVSGVLPMANGGTDKALTPELGGIVYTDAGSMEILGAGTLGQLLKSNGAAAPEWTTLSVDDATFSGVLSLGKGGTNKSLTASEGAIAYSDTDSLELLAPGTAGQILQSNGVGAPSYVNKSISGKAENDSSVTLEEIQVSNNQLTQTDTNKHLLESGNSNILANPSFEHSTASTSWTSSAGTLAEDLSVVVNGKKSLSVNLSTQALAVTQDSTLYAAQFADGVQGLASIRVKTSLSGVKVCSRQASVTSTSNCVDVQGNGKWGFYKVPMILGATSNGISIHSNGTSLTGTVYLDDAFVGAASLTQNMNACNDVSCETEFSAKISSTGVISSENLDWLSSCTNTSTGQYTCTFNSGIFSVAPNCVINRTSSSSQTIHSGIVSVSSSQVLYDTSAWNIANPYFFNVATTISCQKQGADFTAAKQLSNGNTYSSTNADTDWADYIPTVTNLGTGSGVAQGKWKRKGSDLQLMIRFQKDGTNGSGSSIVSFSLPSGLSIDGSKLNSTDGSAIGTLYFSNLTSNANSCFSYAHSSANSIRATCGGAAIVGSSVLAGNVFDMTISVPIEGWQQSNLIIAELSGLQSCTDTLECTDTFSAKISSTGVTSDENVDFLSGNCSLSTNTFSCNFKSGIFSVTPNCVIASQDGAANGNMAMILTQSASAFSYKTVRHDSVALATGVNIICQKQGVDYVGKTARAVSSDQNLRTPGVTNAVFYSAGINSAGGILTEIGDFINGNCSCSSGSYSCSFVSGAFTSTPSCQITNPNSRDRTVLYPTESTSSLTWSVLTQSGTGVCEAVKISCHGVK